MTFRTRNHQWRYETGLTKDEGKFVSSSFYSVSGGGDGFIRPYTSRRLSFGSVICTAARSRTLLPRIEAFRCLACCFRRGLTYGPSYIYADVPSLPDPSPSLSRTSQPGAFAPHVRLLSWFLDLLDPPAAPFGVHRRALAGRAASKDVGMWFGPSATAGAVRADLLRSMDLQVA
ncbi:hypothetical protein DFH07DRAFT_317844 [Mycena maculata]|uniref:Cysteine protease n=1 Tax=Mycena maculata TaxID=230809 RepID=A0AAD7KFJ9_9AGAR|nr:hypothetical protein DFH07DRAFT_317844 [Mycena maculata]